jgi:hypothetical protein
MSEHVDDAYDRLEKRYESKCHEMDVFRREAQKACADYRAEVEALKDAMRVVLEDTVRPLRARVAELEGALGTARSLIEDLNATQYGASVLNRRDAWLADNASL